MSNVISWKPKLHSLRTDVRSRAGPIGMLFNFVPKSVEISSCSSVSYDSVERVGYPIASSCNIALKHRKRVNWTDHQVVLDNIPRLNTVLNKYIVTLNSVSDILFNQQIMGSMDGQDSRKRVMDWYSSYEALWYLSCHVEMSAVTSNNLWLSAICELGIAERCIKPVFNFTSHHQMWPMSFINRGRVSLHFYISCEQRYFCSHIEIFSSVSLNSWEMLKFEWFRNCQSFIVTWLACNYSILTFVMIKSRGSNSDSLSNFPINSLSKMNCGLSRRDSGIKVSPSRDSGNSVHIEFTVSASDHLISDCWKLLIVVASVKSESELVLIGNLRCAGSELSSIQKEVACIESHVFFVGEEDATAINDHREKLGSTCVY